MGTLLFFHTLVFHSLGILHTPALIPIMPAAACTPAGAPTGVATAISNIVDALTTIGAVVCALGIAVGGLMRATSFGSERRISESNTAITCAVVGLLTVLLAQSLGTWIGGLIQPSCGTNTGLIHLLNSLGVF